MHVALPVLYEQEQAMRHTSDGPATTPPVDWRRLPLRLVVKTLWAICRGLPLPSLVPHRRKCSVLPRAISTPTKRLTRREKIAAWELSVEKGWDADRPSIRGDCLPGGVNAARPCPWVSCRYHLALEVHPETGSLKVVFPDPDDPRMPNFAVMPQTCALDVVDGKAATDAPEMQLEAVANLCNKSIERARQISSEALQGLLIACRRQGIISMPPEFVSASQMDGASSPPGSWTRRPVNGAARRDDNDSDTRT